MVDTVECFFSCCLRSPHLTLRRRLLLLLPPGGRWKFPSACGRVPAKYLYTTVKKNKCGVKCNGFILLYISKVSERNTTMLMGKLNFVKFSLTRICDILEKIYCGANLPSSPHGNKEHLTRSKHDSGSGPPPPPIGRNQERLQRRSQSAGSSSPGIKSEDVNKEGYS